MCSTQIDQFDLFPAQLLVHTGQPYSQALATDLSVQSEREVVEILRNDIVALQGRSMFVRQQR